LLTFYNEKGEGFGAQVEFTVKNAVNGERSVSGTIISNDRVLSEIDIGWKFELNGEFYSIVYAKPRDEGRNLSVSFDAVHQFFYDFEHSNCYTEFNGSHRFEVYIEAIFKDSGYRYQIEPSVRVNSIRKENFGNAKRLGMFKDIIKAAGLEFSVSGKVVLITKKIGADLSTVVRKNFNMNELVIEKNINKFITYKRGLGAWKDEEDHSKGRYTSEYESPLARIYGRIEGEPVRDERYKETGKLLERLKFEVDNSYSISVQLDMEDLTRAGYRYTQPRAGDYIMAINETIGFREKIRIVSFESSYDVTGRLINHKVTCNDIGSVQKQISSEGSIIRSVGQSKEFAESALAVATRALVSADGKNTVYYGATKPKDEPIGTINRGDILYLTAGENTEMYIWNGAEWELKKLKLDTSELEKEFDKFKKATEQANEESKRRSEEALKKARAGYELADEAKHIVDETQIALSTIANKVNKQEDEIIDFKNEYGSKMLEVTQTTDGIKTKIGEITSFIDKDGQRQEELKRYAREETAKQTSVIRETLSQDFVAKSTYLENVEGTNQRFEAITRDNEAKFAEYKQGIDGRITDIASQVAGKVNEVDFQRVKETSQLYERVLGNTEQGLPDKISRLVMSNEIFQTEVNDLVVSDNNLIVNSEKLDKHTIVAKKDGVSIYNTSYGVFNIDAQGLTGYNWGGFTLPIYVPKILKGEVYTLGFKYKIRRQLDHEFCVVIKNHSQNKTVLQKTIANPETPVRNVWIDFQGTFKMTEDLDFDQVGNFPIFFYLVKNGWVEVKEPMLVRGPRTGSFKPSQFDEAYRNLEATKTQVTQLAGSWSVKNLNSAGDVLGAINLNPDGSVKINEGLISVGEKTYIKDGVIKKSMIGDAQIGTAHIGEIDASKANIINISAKNVVMDSAMANKMVSSDIFTDALAAKTAFINKLRSSVVTATLLEGYKGRIGGFQIGTHEKDPSVYWLTGQNQFAVGMSNGSSAWGQTALWVNWGTDWGKSGPYAWYVLRTGEMHCKNDASFYKKVDFSSESSVNFYGNINYYKEPKFFKGLNMWDSEIIGSGSNPKGGNNAVVWWNQVGSGSVKYWSDKASDKRLKENIAPTTINALNIINKLDMVEFDFIENHKHEEVGLIAQEVEKIIPQAISRNPDNEDDFLHIDYTTFVPYLIKAIQELNQKLEEVNERRN
jgi:hypothetical protein